LFGLEKNIAKRVGESLASIILACRAGVRVLQRANKHRRDTRHALTVNSVSDRKNPVSRWGVSSPATGIDTTTANITMNPRNESARAGLNRYLAPSANLATRRYRTINLEILNMSEQAKKPTIYIDTYGRKAPDAADISKAARNTKQIEDAIQRRNQQKPGDYYGQRG
jgi:hypothetical protein